MKNEKLIVSLNNLRRSTFKDISDTTVLSTARIGNPQILGQIYDRVRQAIAAENEAIAEEITVFN